MTTIVTRAGKGSALTVAELDANLTNLNTGKVEDADTRASIRPSLLIDFAKTKALDPRITFTRGSTGTFYDGKTSVLAEQNFLTYSQDLSASVWLKSNTTATANATTAPDGSVTASSLIEAASSSIHTAANSVAFNASTTYTASFFAKPNGRNYVYFVNYSTNNNNNISVVFNVSTGIVTQTYAIGTGYSVVSASISASTNGFYRCIVTYTTGTTAPATSFIGLSDSATFTPDAYGRYSYIGDGTSGAYIWGAQLEQRSTVTAYTKTTTAAITNYIPALQTAGINLPRFDVDPVTLESKGLLIEEQRTNLLTYSSDLGNTSGWNVQTNVVISSNVGIAPDGTLSAALLTNTTASGQHRIYRAPSITSSQHTISIYAKLYSANFIQLTLTDGVNGYGYAANFDLSNGTNTWTYASNGTVSASVQSVGNGWYRCSVTPSATTGANHLSIGVLESSITAVVPSYVGTGKGIYIWGAQLEAGAFATSYIPTVASQVTRSSEFASMTGTNFSSWYRTDEGTLYGQASTLQGGTSSTNGTTLFSVWDGTQNNRISITVRQNGLNGSNGFIVAGGSVQTAFRFTFGTDNKTSMTYKNNDASSVLNGGTTQTDSSVIIPTVSQAVIGFDGSTITSGTIKRIAYYPKRLSNIELQNITS